MPVKRALRAGGARLAIQILVLAWRNPIRRRGSSVMRRRWAALEQAHHNLRTVIDASPVPMLVMDSHGMARVWNPAAQRLFGWTQQQVAGLANPTVPCERVEEYEQLRRRAEADGSVTGFETVRHREDGSTVEVSLSMAALRDAGDGVNGILTIFEDITERKRVEQALKDTERGLTEAREREREAASRLAALEGMRDLFLTAVSHELRTPLTSVLGFSETLAREGERLDPDLRTEIAERIAVNAERLNQLLSDLLDLDRLRRGVVEPKRRSMNLAALVARVVEESPISSERKVNLALDPVVIDVDPAMIERIVENLLFNAARHTPPGSRVWVSVAQRDGEGVLEVADEGLGVPPEAREAVFEPFIQGVHRPSHSPGMGIGLSLVARFAEVHGGRAEIDDRAGGGAVFRIRIPMGGTVPQGVVMEGRPRSSLCAGP